MDKKRIGKVLLVVSLTACLTMGSVMPVSAASKVFRPAKDASQEVYARGESEDSDSFHDVKKEEFDQITGQIENKYQMDYDIA